MPVGICPASFDEPPSIDSKDQNHTKHEVPNALTGRSPPAWRKSRIESSADHSSEGAEALVKHTHDSPRNLDASRILPRIADLDSAFGARRGGIARAEWTDTVRPPGVAGCAVPPGRTSDRSSGCRDRTANKSPPSRRNGRNRTHDSPRSSASSPMSAGQLTFARATLSRSPCTARG